jgi:diguanylate cyclase (GGDEF)-like protein/PAS domain S-box-containing protein
MHRLLRRQLELHLGAGHEPAPEVRELLRDVDAEYRRADEDRTSLRHALDLVADLARRRPETACAEADDAKRARPLARLFEQAPFAAILCDPDLEILAWNPAAERLFGFAAADAIGRELGFLLTDEERVEGRRLLRAAVAAGEPQEALRLGRERSGASRLDAWTVAPLRGRRGQVAGAAVLVREVAGALDHHALAAQAIGDALWDWDPRADRLWLSPAWAALTGAPAAGAAPSAWLDRVHPSDREPLEAAIRAHLEGGAAQFQHEHRLRREPGEWRWVLARGRATRDPAGKAVRFCGALTDVTEQKAAAERALHDALHDPLTRLPNRALFLDLVKRAFARARRRDGYGFAVVFLDVDRFKNVNDGLGHAAGDELLSQMSRRLQTCLREGDTLARYGGDEFTILLDDVKGPADAQIVAERIHASTTQPFDLGGREIYATASVGLALSSPSYARPEDLLRDADTAMYRAKGQGRARSVLFDASMRERAPQLLDLEADLRNALVREEFRVHYLPVVELATGRIQALEALVRWAHPTRGLVGPEHFVPFAEETGFIVPLGSWLLRQAGRDFASCRRVGTPLSLHVNLSTKQLLHGDLLSQIDGVLEEHRIDAKDLAFELTEQTLLNTEHAASRLSQLHDRGLRLCIDDFGTGSSSLSSLHRFQLDSLKIDRSLFSGGSPHGQAPDLVRTIVALGREMGKNVVAEGVETPEQFRFLRDLGCAGAQGFYFSPPVEGAAARSLLERGDASWWAGEEPPRAAARRAPRQRRPPPQA